MHTVWASCQAYILLHMYGNLECFQQVAQKVNMANELQQNQRAAVRREHVVEIRFHDEEEYA